MNPAIANAWAEDAARRAAAAREAEQQEREDAALFAALFDDAGDQPAPAALLALGFAE